MSVVDAYYNKKKEDEEKKVVGQQQKTQSSANKPTGSTSIPKDKQEDSRTQKSAASSLRTENNTTTAGPRKEESKTNIIRRNTVTANKAEQKQNITNRSTYRSTSGNNRYKDNVQISDSTQRLRNERNKNRNPGVDQVTVSEETNRLRRSRAASHGDSYEPMPTKADLRNRYFGMNDIGPQSLPDAKDFQRSRMSEAERMQDIARSIDMGTLGTNTPSRRDVVNNPILPRQQYETPVFGGATQNKQFETPVLGGAKQEKQFETPVFQPVPSQNNTGIRQLDNLNDYIMQNNPQPVNQGEIDEFWNDQINNYLKNGTQRQDSYALGKDSNVLESFFTGVNKGASGLGASLVSKANALGNVFGDVAGLLPNMPGVDRNDPEQAYNRVMSAQNGANKLASIIAPQSDKKDLETFQNYVADKYVNGTVTQQDIDRLNEMKAVVNRNDFMGRTENEYKNLLAMNEGAEEAHPVANFAGQMVPATMQNIAGSELAGAISEGLPAVSGLAGKALNDAVELSPDMISDIIPSIENDIASGKSQDEVFKNAMVNIALNYGFNKLTDAGGKLLSRVIRQASDNVNASAFKNANNQSLDDLLPGNPNVVSGLNGQLDNGVEGVSKQIYNEGVNPDFARGFNYGENIGNQQRTIWNGSGSNIEGYRQPDIQKPGGKNAFSGKNGQPDSSILRKSTVNNTDGVIRNQMNNANISDVGMKYNTDVQKYSQALEAARKSNGHGVFVSGKSPEELQEIIDNGGKLLIDDYGRAGVVIAPNGDIEGVFHNGKLAEQLGLPKKKALSDLMITAIANGGDRLDCYGEDLARMYMRYGFEPVAVSEYVPNKPWSVDMDAWKADEIRKLAGAEGTPTNTDVYILKLRDGWTVDDAIEAASKGTLNDYAENADLSMANINKNVPDEIKQLPLENQYDSMMKYRDSLLDMDLQYFSKQPEKGAFFNGNNAVPNPDMLPNASKLDDGIFRSENSGQKKTSKWRTGTAEKTGRMEGHETDLPKEDYDYWVKHEEEANAQARERYKDSKDLYSDLLQKEEAYDDADIKASMNEWQRLMDEGTEESIKKANRLGIKISAEGRRGGREIQAFAEFGRNTPEGQIREANKAIGDAVDTKYGKGTTEGLDNIAVKITKLYEDSKNVDEFKAKLHTLLSKNMKEFVSSETAKDMAPKKIRGVKNIDKLIGNKKNLSEVDVDTLIQTLYKKNNGVRLSATDTANVHNLLKEAQKFEDGSRDQEKMLARAAKIVCGKIPSTLGDKVRTILYDNMLGNFKTALSRNAFGNAAYQVLEQSRSPIAAGIDWATSKVTGKHSTLGWNTGKAIAYGKGFVKGAAEQLSDMANYIDTGRSGAKGWEEALKNNKQVWGDRNNVAKLANGVDFYVKNAMELGDRPFYEANYAQRATELRQLVDRYGKENVAGLAGIKDENVDAVIDMIASLHAADSVFQKQGVTAEGLTKLRDGLADLSRGVLGVDLLSTSAAPFTLTPGNMLEKATELSPFGVVKNAVNTAKEIGTGNFNQRRFVDETSRNILGSGLAAGAFAGAKAGLISGGYSKDLDEKRAQQDDGYIEYGLKTPWGTYDTSDIPGIGPLMQAGGAIYENGLTPESALQAAEAITLGTTVQGLNKIAGTNANYSSNSSILDNAADTIKSAGTQLVPSFLRQTAQTMDKYKRDLGEYGTDEYYLNSIINSLPFARETLPIKYDNEGQPVLQNQGRGLGSKILENYLLPMARSEYNPSRLNQEATRIQDETGNAYSFVPKALRSDLRAWDEKAGVEYSEEQFRNYKKNFGTLNHEVGEALLDSEFYQGLSDSEKETMLQKLYSGMKQVAKINSIGGETDDKIANAYMESKEEGVINQLEESYKADKADSFMKENEITSNSTLGKAIKAAYIDGDEELANSLAEDYNYLKDNDFSDKIANYTKAKDNISGLTAEEYVNTFKDMDSDNNNSLKQDEVLDWINSQHITDKDTMEQYYNSYYTGNSEKAPQYNNGQWEIPKSKQSSKNQSSSSNTSQSNGDQLMTGNSTLDARIKAKQKAANESQGNSSANGIENASWTVTTKGGKDVDLHTTKTYQRAQAAGWSDSDFLKHFHGADTDNSGTITKKENQAYINALEGLSRQEKHDMFDVLQTRKAKNPY